ncbi:MAG: methyltransferase family protein [Chitinophagales bacterium]
MLRGAGGVAVASGSDKAIDHAEEVEKFWGKILMTFLRALVFTLIVPCSVAVYVPLFVLKTEWQFHFTGSNFIGFFIISIGALGYFWTVISFLLQGKGTPAIWFTKKLSFLIGKEPSKTVTGGLYRFSRNPMYLSVFISILGLGIFKENFFILVFAAIVFVLFHLAVVFIEEPHLRKKFGESYKEYFNKTRRWL